LPQAQEIGKPEYGAIPPSDLDVTYLASNIIRLSISRLFGLQPFDFLVQVVSVSLPRPDFVAASKLAPNVVLL